MKTIEILKEDYRQNPNRDENWEKNISTKYLNEMVCHNCRKKVEYKDIVKITKKAIFLRSVDDNICCSKSCSASLTNIKVHKNNPSRGIEFNKQMISRLQSVGFDNFYKNPSEMKKSISIRNSNDNPKWHSSHTSEKYSEIKLKAGKDIRKRLKGKTLEEIYGKEKADMIKLKNSKSNSGENNPMYGKPSGYFTGGGISGKYKQYYFRSLLELSFILEMEYENVNFISAENSKFKIEYEYENTTRNYFPDFYLIDSDTVIEIKPYRSLNDRLNKVKFEKAYGTFNNFVIITEKNIENVLTIEKLKDLMISNNKILISDHSKKKFEL